MVVRWVGQRVDLSAGMSVGWKADLTVERLAGVKAGYLADMWVGLMA